MAAKRKFMDTELPPQESEGKEEELLGFGLIMMYDHIMVYQYREMSVWGTASAVWSHKDEKNVSKKWEVFIFVLYTDWILLSLFFMFLLRPLPGFKPTSRDMAHRRWDLPESCFFFFFFPLQVCFSDDSDVHGQIGQHKTAPFGSSRFILVSKKTDLWRRGGVSDAF